MASAAARTGPYVEPHPSRRTLARPLGSSTATSAKSRAMPSTLARRSVTMRSWFSGSYEIIPESDFSRPPMRCSRPGVPGRAQARTWVSGSRWYGWWRSWPEALCAFGSVAKPGSMSGMSETSGTCHGSEPLARYPSDSTMTGVRYVMAIRAASSVVSKQSPGDCFDTTLEAARIAITYRTPVIVLSDGYLANGSEPWHVPDVSDIPLIDPGFATEPNAHNASGQERHHPYQRNPETQVRDWALPGTPGLEHRIGGLEKSDSGMISHDPENHDRMVTLRRAKVDGIARDFADVAVDDPSGRAKVLLLGWGSTYGPDGIGRGSRRR